VVSQVGRSDRRIPFHSARIQPGPYFIQLGDIVRIDTISARDVSEATSVMDMKNVEGRLRGQDAGELAAKEVIAQGSRGRARARGGEGLERAHVGGFETRLAWEGRQAGKQWRSRENRDGTREMGSV
jgi:hypothetical protein